MANDVTLPRLGQGMESGTIVRWLKSEGDQVEKGEPLYELDTDKVTQEVEADASGVLLRIAVQEGEVEVGRTIAFVGEEGEQVPDEVEPIPFAQGRVHREGEDVTVVATGRLVHEALAAAGDAERDGISVEVFDPRTLLPLDEDAIVASVKKTTRAVTAHEAVTRGGFGAELSAVIQHGAFDYLDAPIERVGAKFAPLAFAPAMEQWVVPHAADVLAAIKRTVARA